MHRKTLAAGFVILALVSAGCSKSSSTTTETSPVAPASSGMSAAPGGTMPASGTATAEEYVNGMCTSLDTWLNSIMEQSSVNTASGSPKEAKKKVVSFLQGMVTVTDQLVSDMNALGAPDVEGGAEAHTALMNAFTTVQETFQKALDDAQNLNTKDAATFAGQVATIQGQIQAAATEVGTSLNALSSPALDQAATESQACTDMLDTINSANAATTPAA